MCPDRSGAVEYFLRQFGWDDATRSLLAGDASFRRYERLQRPNGDTAVLMDAPRPQEGVRPFVCIAEHLVSFGLSAPRILAKDEERGLLLLEDFGDSTYTRLLKENHDERKLYELATDALIHLHARPSDTAVPDGVGDYSEPRLIEEVDRLHVWYLPLVDAPALSDQVQATYTQVWRDLFPHAWTVPLSLALFDYHVDNLMLLPDRNGVAACGLLDFQDGVRGPVTYDLMSLLEDARRDIDPTLVAAMKDRYLAAFPNIDETLFDQSWAVMAAQRHVRVIGTFARLKLRDHKSQYLIHIPRLWRYMDQCLTHPLLAPLKNWLDENVPPSLRQVRV